MKDVEFENLDLKTTIFVDTRTNAEYLKGHITDAVNIPLLDNEQRAIVGTLYKQKGQETAILKALELASPNFPMIYSSLLNLKKNNPDKKLVIYCARGGMRSGSVHAFMDSLKIDSLKLKGGYKRYRNIVLDTIERKIPNIKFIILNGYTGSGKTAIIKKMQNLNIPAIDLEELAKHMGSAFGSIPYKGERVTQQQFENDLATEILKLKDENIIFLEGESKRIGWIQLNNNFMIK